MSVPNKFLYLYKHIPHTYIFCCFGVTLGNDQGLLLDLHTGITPEGAPEPSGTPWIKLRLYERQKKHFINYSISLAQTFYS